MGGRLESDRPLSRPTRSCGFVEDELVIEDDADPEPARPSRCADIRSVVPLPEDVVPIVAPTVNDPIAGADGELSVADANNAIATGAAPQGETLEEAHPGLDPKEYLALLKEVLAAQKEKVAERLEEKIAAKQEAKMATLSSILGWLSLLGLFLLLMPLGLRKKYPGQDKLLLKYSAVAACTFVVAVWLFSRVVLLLKAIQGALSSLTNPQVAVIDATFTVLENNVEDLVEVGPVLIEAPLAQVASGEQDSLPMAILDNIQRINEDVTVFKNIARQFEGVFALFGYLPVVLTIVAVVLFALSIKPVIVSIVAMPGRVAAGEAKAADVVKDVFRTIGREFLATLCLIGALVVVTIFSGIMLSLAVEPAIEAFLAYVFTSVIYTMAAPEFSKFAVYMSVMGALLFLVLNVAIVLVANVLFFGKVQKIFKRKFHDQVPVGAHKRFWGWGSLSLVWAHVLPVVFVAIAQEGIGKLVDSMTSGPDINWTALLVSGPGDPGVRVHPRVLGGARAEGDQLHPQVPAPGRSGSRRPRAHAAVSEHVPLGRTLRRARARALPVPDGRAARHGFRYAPGHALASSARIARARCFVLRLCVGWQRRRDRRRVRRLLRLELGRRRELDDERHRRARCGRRLADARLRSDCAAVLRPPVSFERVHRGRPRLADRPPHRVHACADARQLLRHRGRPHAVAARRRLLARRRDHGALPRRGRDGLPGVDDIGASLDGDSPTVLIEAETGQLVPHFAEFDLSAVDPERRVLFIRPALRLRDATRYIVGIRHVVDAAGAPLPASPAFAALRDLTELPDEPSVDSRRPLYADIFARLDGAGVPRADLQLAWDFTTASDANNTAWLVHMRDEALALVGDPPVYDLATEPLGDDGTLLVTGTFEVPLFLDQPGPGAVMNLGADGLPESNGTFPFEFSMVIPPSAVDEPVALLHFGHGLLGTRAEIERDELVAVAREHGYAIYSCRLDRPRGPGPGGHRRDPADGPARGLREHVRAAATVGRERDGARPRGGARHRERPDGRRHARSIAPVLLWHQPGRHHGRRCS